MSISLQTQVPTFAERSATSGKAVSSDSLTGVSPSFIFIRRTVLPAARQKAKDFLDYMRNLCRVIVRSLAYLQRFSEES